MNARQAPLTNSVAAGGEILRERNLGHECEKSGEDDRERRCAEELHDSWYMTRLLRNENVVVRGEWLSSY
jgi:hypothetical protein